MLKGNIFSALLAAVVLAFAMPTMAMAAPIEVTASVKSSLDKTITGTDQSQASKINALYAEFLTLQNQQKDWDAKIKAVHAGNTAALSALNKLIKQIDEAKLDELEAEVDQTKERYKPLFAQYTALNKQIEAARSVKNKDLSSLLRLQASLLKIPVQLARKDIESKENTLRAAKNNAAAAMKEIRSSLAGADPAKAQMKGKQEAIKSLGTSVTPVWNTFKAAVKKGDSSGVLDTLESLVSYSRQINEKKQEIFELESRISQIYSAAKSQLK